MFHGVRVQGVGLGEAGLFQAAGGFFGLEAGFFLDAAGFLLGGAALGLLFGLAAGDRGFRRAGEADMRPVGAVELRRAGFAGRLGDDIGWNCGAGSGSGTHACWAAAKFARDFSGRFGFKPGACVFESGCGRRGRRDEGRRPGGGRGAVGGRAGPRGACD